MKIHKKIISTILAIVLTVSALLVPATAFAASKPTTPTITKLTAEKGTTSIVVQWKSLKNAKGCVIECSTDPSFPEGNTERYSVMNAQKTSRTLDDCMGRCVYYVRMRSYVLQNNSKRVYGNWSNVKKIRTKMPTAQIKSCSSSSGRNINLSWSGSHSTREITGWQIKYSTSADFSRYGLTYALADPLYAKTSTTIENLHPGVCYYFAIRTYRNDGAKNYYGAWSNVVSQSVNNKVNPSYNGVPTCPIYDDHDWIYVTSDKTTGIQRLYKERPVYINSRICSVCGYNGMTPDIANMQLNNRDEVFAVGDVLYDRVVAHCRSCFHSYTLNYCNLKLAYMEYKSIGSGNNVYVDDFYRYCGTCGCIEELEGNCKITVTDDVYATMTIN